MTVNEKHVVGGVQPVIEAGVGENQSHRNDNLDCRQSQHGGGGQQGVTDEAQLPVGDEIHQSQGNNLPDHQIQPVELTEHGAFRVQEQGVQQNAVDAHQHIFSFVDEVFQVIADFPGKVIGQGQQNHFQQCLRYPDKALHILISAAA